MTDEQILVSHATDLKRQCADNSMITSTQFLDMRQRSLIAPLERQFSEYVTTLYFGGYDDAERVCALFVPKFFGISDISDFLKNFESDNPLSLLRLDKDRFTTVSHRDYLGALMGLGIKREMIGDILVDDKGAFVPCVNSVAEFLLKNLTSVGRATVNVSLTLFDKISERTERFNEISAFVASLRLDNVVSSAFSLSRTKSAEFIEKGAVYLSGVQNFKSDVKVNQGDKIVLRGKGKAVLYSIDGESKKGRLHITIRKYI